MAELRGNDTVVGRITKSEIKDILGDMHPDFHSHLFSYYAYYPNKKRLEAKIKRGYADYVVSLFPQQSDREKVNLIRLFFLVVLLNSQNTYLLTMKNIAYSMGGLNVKTVKRYFNLLEDKKLISVSWMQDGNIMYDSYYARILTVLPDDDKNGIYTVRYTISKEFERILINNLSHRIGQYGNSDMKPLFYIRHRKKRKNNLDTVIPKTLADDNTNIRICDIPVSQIETDSSCQLVNFTDRLFGFYDELSYDGLPFEQAAYFTSDGRVHHKIHELPHDVREKHVIWDAEHIEEIWDGHNMFFTLMFCDMSTKKMIEPTYKQWVLFGNMYNDVANYISHRCGVPITRERSKELLQRYKNTTKDKLIRKDGCYNGTISWYKRQYSKYGADEKLLIQHWVNGSLSEKACNVVSKYMLRYVDEYFIKHYPHVRDYIMTYPTRIEDGEEYYKQVNGKTVLYHKPRKVVSNLQKDLTKYETEIVSNRLCRKLWERYGIKSVSLHDAIYVKQSDGNRIRNEGISIDDMFRAEVESYEYHEPTVMPLWETE